MRYRIQVILIIIGILFLEAGVIHYIHYKLEKKMLMNNAEKENATAIDKSIVNDIRCFPVALQYMDDISFEDSFGAYRENGGHEGCDIMYKENVAGVVPIISATDGTITNLGWLYLGGYRIGITSEGGNYYYYAHLDSYFPGLYVGKKMKAGEFLGFMGNTGEGEEGTMGKFPVHLHFGIYVEDKNGNEKSVNPYPYLLKINAD